MHDDHPIITHSPLTQTCTADGHSLRIEIYRGAGSQWILEVQDERGNSTVWDEQFETDAAALQVAMAEIEAEGVQAFVTELQRGAAEAAPELMRRLDEWERERAAAQLAKRRRRSVAPPDLAQPLSEAEWDELEHFLLYLDAEESMTLDMLDGFLHALAMGPELVMPTRWLPLVWGQDEGELLPLEGDEDEADEAEYWVSLVLRLFNGIVAGLSQSPPEVSPVWSVAQFGDGQAHDDAEMWAHGFTEGVKLSQAAWQPMLDDPDGQRWYRPIGLLGDSDFSADQDELTRAPEQRAALAAQIADNLLHIHAFWLPVRHAMAGRQQAQLLSQKVGRNAPCPCGSGKKFKRCCGAAGALH